MGDDFYASIKLISGEEIVASVCIDETNEDSVIIAHSPVVMKMLHGGSYVKIQPWMELADDDMFIFTLDKRTYVIFQNVPERLQHASAKTHNICPHQSTARPPTKTPSPGL